MRVKRPDRKNALSILFEAEHQMQYTLTLSANEESAFNIVRNIYECFRMLGDSLLASKGMAAEDHVAAINALLDLPVETRRSTQVIDSLRKLRHNINYYGYRPTLPETIDAIDIARACFKPLAQAIRKEIQQPALI